MPNDLYQWEAGGGLGTSGSCDPCSRSDEEHLKRHREIAELLHELKAMKLEQPPASPLTPKAVNIVQQAPIMGEASPKKKKERKAAKKAIKVSLMPKVVSSADTEFVASVLHADEMGPDDTDIERQLLEDPDIKLNRFFHKGTSNRRDIRNAFVKADKKGHKVELRVDSKDLDGLLQLLDVSPITHTSGTEEKAVHAKLRDKIENDLIKAKKEEDQTQMRKAGFWRWASKRAYNRLVEHGRIWSDKSGDQLVVEPSDSSTGTSTSTGLDVDTDPTEADTDITTPSEGEELTVTISQLKTADKSTSSDAMAPSSIDDGWKIVGKPSTRQTTKKPVGNLKLLHNRGLSKLVQSPGSKCHGFNAHLLHAEEGD